MNPSKKSSPATAASGSHRAYHVVAYSIPIVYTQEGDHDPNGMAYVLKPVQVLLKWAKERWNDNDRLLPNLNFRHQRAQLVVDGLERLEVMLHRLRHGPEEDQRLLAELIRREELPEYDEPDDRAGHARHAQGGRAAAVRTNVMRQIKGLRIALADLRALDPRASAALAAGVEADEAAPLAPLVAGVARTVGRAHAQAGTDRERRLALWQARQRLDRQLANEKKFRDRFAVEAEEADDADEADADETRAAPARVTRAALAADADGSEIRLVTLGTEERRLWREHWIVQVKMLSDAMERALERIDERWMQDQNHLNGGEIPAPWVKRLLLNDHQLDSQRHLPCNRFNPLKPIPALRPLVLRCREGEKVDITFENGMKLRRVGFHVQGGGMAVVGGDNPGTPNGAGVKFADGAVMGTNEDSTVEPGKRLQLRYDATNQGVWPLNDLADVRGGEDGSNAHGLFGALIVEPEGAEWHDPEWHDPDVVPTTDKQGNGVKDEAKRGEWDLTDAKWCSLLDVDIVFKNDEFIDEPKDSYVDLASDKGKPRSFREFTTFFHDQPEVRSGLHTVGEHSIMPLSYRAEPMHNRLPHRMRHYAEETLRRDEEARRRNPPLVPNPDAVDRRAVMWQLGDELDEQFLTARTGRGEWLEYVAGEEQHHSSWLFGDPVTHVQRAYAGDPCRVRLVHAGVKETHIYHLHVHQWRAVAADAAAPSVHGSDAAGNPIPKGSQLLDSITIGPQAAMTIDPLYGSGSRQKAIGDIIWHCHLYPHFHHGMWGLWRSYSHLVDGSRAYPDGSHCAPLHPLPGRVPAIATWDQPGFPWFIDGEFPMKSPPPPVPLKLPLNGRRVLLGMPRASAMELAAMDPACRNGDQPGSLFVDLDGDAATWFEAAKLPKEPRILSYDIEVLSARTTYNVEGWHDPRGHLYRLQKVQVREWSKDADDGKGSKGAYVTTHTESFAHAANANPVPLYPRANHGDIVEWRQHNSLRSFQADKFDLGQLPVEVGLHVHLVKFDPLASDGSSTGWNYLSGASCREAVGADGEGELRTVSLHRWVVDEEFGPCFFHDHLLANFRQKHGLFSALIAEPYGSQWTRVDDPGQRAWGDAQAVVLPPPSSGLPPFREACIGICDFVALLDAGGRALNPPSDLSGDDDPGSMTVNYRCAPLTFRGKDPSQWFSTSAHSRPNLEGVHGDPDTPVIRTYPGERLRIRLVQGSHEEQHGFALHGMRWRRDWGNPKSPLVNQQTLGISEAFTLDIDPASGDSPYRLGDHLWHFCAMDDVWLGCWGIVRSLPALPANIAKFAPLPDLSALPKPPDAPGSDKPSAHTWPTAVAINTRTFVVVAERTEHRMAGTALTDPWGLIYRVTHHEGPRDLNADASAIEAALQRAREEDRWDWNDSRRKSKRSKKPCLSKPRGSAADNQPLVLRARRGEWIRVILVNDLYDEDDSDDTLEHTGRIEFGVEPSPPRLPLEHLDEHFRPDERSVSSRVSLHASLLCYDVRHHDGSYVGDNPDTTVGAFRESQENGMSHDGPQMMQMPQMPQGGVVHRTDHHGRRNWREYWWYADGKLAPKSHKTDNTEDPGQVCFLHDMADLRNHRHHGLVGALVVLPGDVTPFKLETNGNKSADEGWYGVNAVICETTSGDPVAHETAVFVQDGLRLFVNGHPDYPVPDANPGDDPEDSGQKAVNYRSHPVHRGKVSTDQTSVFPLMKMPAPGTMWLRLIGAGDKPRQHTMAIHGCAWLSAPWVNGSDAIGALTGLSPCRVENIVVHLPHPGDYAVRAGGFRWASEHGVWASVRVSLGD